MTDRQAHSATAGEEREATQRVLDAVRVDGCDGRPEVVRLTGLSRATVAQRTRLLVESGLLEESGNGVSTGGRPPRRLRFHAERGHLLVADLGATSIDVAVADLAGTIVGHRAEPADIAAGPEAVLSRVEGMFDELRDRLPGALGPLWGLGAGVPGPVEFMTGTPVAPPIMPGWDRYPIRDRLQLRYGVPVWVDNDVNVMAMGEWRFGIARGHRDVIWIKIGTGIGAGLISAGRPHRGSDGAAGDIGHIQVCTSNVVCRCGNLGCLEAAAGGAAIARDAEGAARSGRSAWLAEAYARDGSVSSRTVALGAAHGDPVSIELLQTAGRLIGGVLATAVNLFNPSLIVIGGGVAEAGDLLLATIRETVYGRSLPLATRELRIERSSLGASAGIIGAAATAADQLFSQPNMDALLAGRQILPRS